MNGFRSRRRGLGMIELLISLSIIAGLLTATAMALNASFMAYGVNQQQASLMQQARVAMHRVASSIRTTDAHAPDDSALADDFSAGQTVVGTAIAMIDASGADVIYRFDAANRRVLAIIDGKSHTLATGVDAFSVRMEPMRSPAALKTGSACDLLKRATITLAIRSDAGNSLAGEHSGPQTIVLSAAVAPRQNTW